jgi:hypothetical protein
LTAKDTNLENKMPIETRRVNENITIEGRYYDKIKSVLDRLEELPKVCAQNILHFNTKCTNMESSLTLSSLEHKPYARV